MSRILVTGGSGLIGWATTEHLVREGHHVVVFDKRPARENLRSVIDDVPIVEGDVSDLGALLHAAKSNRVDKIVHLAAFIAHESAGLPAESVLINVRGVANVFDVALALDLERVVWTSTIATVNVGPDYDHTPVDETFIGAPVTPYGIAKYACEKIAEIYNKERGLKSIGLRPPLTYGIGRLSGRTGEFNDAIRKIANGQPGSSDFRVGDQPVQPIYNRDYARFIAAALSVETSLSSHIYNTPVERNYTWNEITEVIQDVVPGADFEARPRPPMYARTPVMDAALAEREIGFVPKYSLRDGIAEMVEHYRES
jgi:UDP-glucose 4-epimerase